MSEDNLSAVFNMGLATLERINNLLNDYRKISIESPNTGDAQLVKYKILRQVYLASVPLLHEKDTKKLKVNERERLKQRVNSVQLNTTKGEGGKTILLYSASTDFLMDEIIEDISLSLQKHGGHFMPEPEEAMF